MEYKVKEKINVKDIEIDAFDLLDGKMKDVALEKLYKKIKSN